MIKPELKSDLTPWSDPSADIGADIGRVQSSSLRTFGVKMRFAYYGRNVLGYLEKNNGVREALERCNHALYEPAVLIAELNRMFDLQWIFNPLIGDDEVAFTADPVTPPSPEPIFVSYSLGTMLALRLEFPGIVLNYVADMLKDDSSGEISLSVAFPEFYFGKPTTPELREAAISLMRRCVGKPVRNRKVAGVQTIIEGKDRLVVKAEVVA